MPTPWVPRKTNKVRKCWMEGAEPGCPGGDSRSRTRAFVCSQYQLARGFTLAFIALRNSRDGTKIAEMKQACTSYEPTGISLDFRARSALRMPPVQSRACNCHRRNRFSSDRDRGQHHDLQRCTHRPAGSWTLASALRSGRRRIHSAARESSRFPCQHFMILILPCFPFHSAWPTSN